MNDIVDLIDLINYRIDTVNSCPQGTPEWSEVLDRISKNIKNLEDRLKKKPDLPSEIKEVRLSVLVDREGKAGTTIEIPAGQRIIYYSDFSELFRKPEKNQRANEDKNNTDKSLLLNILKDAIIRSKDKFADADNLEDILRDLKKHRETVPEDNASLSEKGKWFKELGKTLSSLKIIESAIKSIKDEIPKIWDQLTFKQKLQVALLLPAAVSTAGVLIHVFGIGSLVGNFGLATAGKAVGIPGIYVIIILFYVITSATNDLIEFLDFLIEFLGSLKN